MFLSIDVLFLSIDIFLYSQSVCLEDSTERSESNPGRSLGITNMKYAAVWKTVPTLSSKQQNNIFIY